VGIPLRAGEGSGWPRRNPNKMQEYVGRVPLCGRYSTFSQAQSLVVEPHSLQIVGVKLHAFFRKKEETAPAWSPLSEHHSRNLRTLCFLPGPINIKRADFHGEWNYTISPNTHPPNRAFIL